MQIFKASLLTCAFTLALGTIPLHAADTAAQAAARAALKEKMRELAPPTAAAEAPAVVTQPAPKPAPVTPPPVPAPVAETPAATAPAGFVLPEGASPDLIEQAREANRAARAELERQKKAAAAGQHKKAAPARADNAAGQSPSEKNSDPDLLEQARQATRARLTELQSHKQTAIPAGQEAPVIQPANPPAAANMTTTDAVTTHVKAAAPTAAELRAAKAREAAEQKAEQAKIAKTKAQAAADAKARVAAKNATKPAEPAKPAKPAKKAKPEPAKVDAPVTLAPLEGPASSLPASKDQALRTLLDQYKAEKISAEEYHQQRSKILAEP